MPIPSNIPLILASQSPRRRELLEEAGYQFTILAPSDAAEGDPVPGETPVALVRRLAQAKAGDVANRIANGLVIGCDTVVECQGKILGKPESRTAAKEMLELLRGNLHTVYSGLCLWRRPDDRIRSEVDQSTLRMEPISDQQLEEYLDSGAWEGKAGAFGYQDRLGWLQLVSGSESNIVGLPLELLHKMLEEFPD